MQNGGKSEYQSIAAQYAKAKAEQQREQTAQPKKPTSASKYQEARFTVTQVLLVAFLTLILSVLGSRNCGMAVLILLEAYYTSSDYTSSPLASSSLASSSTINPNAKRRP